MRDRVGGPRPVDALLHIGEQGDLQSLGDLLRDIALDSEDIGQLPVVALGPEMRLRPAVDELGGDADLIAGAAHAALENRPGAKLAADLRDALAAALVADDRGPGDDAQLGDLGEPGDHLLGDAVGEPLVLGVGADVGERQHREATRVQGGAPPPRASGVGLLGG